jgi:cell division transport system permease protein
MPRPLREALQGWARSPLLALLSVVAISLSLFVIGLFGLTAYNIHTTLGSLEERVEVVAYLRDDVTPQQVQLAELDLLGLPEVRGVGYVSKEDALNSAVREMEQFRELFADLESNPLPASLEVTLRGGGRDSRSVQTVAARLADLPIVEEVSYGQEWVEKIVSLRRIAGGATAMIGGAFAAVAGIIIATAVRISVFARRDEIAIMRLVGATDSFIRLPFLTEGLLAGLIGGMVAASLTYGAFRVVTLAILEIQWLPWIWTFGAIACGATYGLISSAVAVRRHLRAI